MKKQILKNRLFINFCNVCCFNWISVIKKLIFTNIKIFLEIAKYLLDYGDPPFPLTGSQESESRSIKIHHIYLIIHI